MSESLLPETDAAFQSGVGAIVGELTSWASTSVMGAMAVSSGPGSQLLAYRRGLQAVGARLPEYEKRLVDQSSGQYDAGRAHVATVWAR
jgi:hypothetical protein